MNKEDFVDWKRHPVTQQVFSMLEGRMREIGEMIIDLSGRDPIQTAEYCGAIKAYRDITDITFEESNGN